MAVVAVVVGSERLSWCCIYNAQIEKVFWVNVSVTVHCTSERKLGRASKTVRLDITKNNIVTSIETIACHARKISAI